MRRALSLRWSGHSPAGSRPMRAGVTGSNSKACRNGEEAGAALESFTGPPAMALRIRRGGTGGGRRSNLPAPFEVERTPARDEVKG
jgi:hypothetical protein